MFCGTWLEYFPVCQCNVETFIDVERKASFLIEHDVREANEDEFVFLICRLNSNKGIDESVLSLIRLQVHFLFKVVSKWLSLVHHFSHFGHI